MIGIDLVVMKNIVISLKNNNEKRKNHIREQFYKQKIDFEFYDAITPECLEKLTDENHIKINQALMSKTEASCFMSHYMIWKKVLDENLDAVAIFEDDIYLSPDAKHYLSSNFKFPYNADIIKLEHFYNEILVDKREIVLDDSRALCRLVADNLGTAGYIITKKGSQYLIDKYSEISEIGAIDTLIFKKFLEDNHYYVYQIAPALCVQDFILNSNQHNFVSDIEVDRNSRIENYQLNKVKYSFSFKLKRELLRIVKNILYKIKSINYKKKNMEFR